MGTRKMMRAQKKILVETCNWQNVKRDKKQDMLTREDLK